MSLRCVQWSHTDFVQTIQFTNTPYFVFYLNVIFPSSITVLLMCLASFASEHVLKCLSKHCIHPSIDENIKSGI